MEQNRAKAAKNQMHSPTYVLVTPVRDEVDTIGRTIQSVRHQNCQPVEWVIVSDGSIDGTNELVEAATRECPWIKLLRLPGRPSRSFAAVVEATMLGVEALECKNYDYLGLLDADVEFEADYFERLLDQFHHCPGLGLAGGVVIDIGESSRRLPRNRIDVPGAVQCFRRKCFESLGGLVPVPEGGWDGLSCAMARMAGYETRLVTDLVVHHLKPRNVSEGGPLRRRWQLGVRDYSVGYSPLFESVKCAGRVAEAPLILGALARWCGFVAASARRQPRIVPSRVVAFVRKEQHVRLLASARELNPFRRTESSFDE